jgi:hypothetical protein
MAGKKITQLNSGSLSNLPLSGVTAVVYSGLTLQHTLSDLRLKLVDSGSHHFTGSNTFTGNQTITGSLLISGSATYDIDVVGSIRTSGPNTNILVSGSNGRSHIGQHEISIESTSVSPYLSTEFGSNVGVYNMSNLTEIGIALNGSEFSDNWSNGPVLYVNNTSGNTYDAVFGFQNKTGYTDGRITLLKNTDLSGSLRITGGVTGSFRGDGSGLTGLTTTLPSGVTSGSQQIVDLGFSTTSSVNQKLDTSSFNTFSSSVNTTTASLNTFSASVNGKTGSFATTGSNVFSGNQIVTGSFDVTSFLNIGTGNGDEGGEMMLVKPITNTNISGSGVIIDAYRDRIRIFEQGGATRGAFLDITKQSNAVSSQIVTSPNLFSIQTITSASYASLTPVSGTLYIIID